MTKKSIQMVKLETFDFKLKLKLIMEEVNPLRSVHLHSDFEMSSSKSLVGGPGFFVYFELDFYCLCSLQKSSSK